MLIWIWIAWPTEIDTVRHIDGALSRVYVIPLYVSVLTEVISIAQVPVRIASTPPTPFAANMNEPAQLTPPLFQNW